MVPDIADSELLRAEAWARANLDLLVAAWRCFDAEDAWPTLERLQRDFERAHVDIDAANLAWQIPNALGFREQERLVLRVRGLSYVREARPLLESWAAALIVAYKRYVRDDAPVLRRSDLRDELGLDERRTDRVSKLLLRESWAFGSISEDPEGEWECEIRAPVRAARDAKDADQLLAARAADEAGGRQASRRLEPSVVPSPREEGLVEDASRKAVMVVHGRDEDARRAMFDFLRALGLRPLEWGMLVAGTDSAAPYVGEVLEHAFHAAAAVVVLFTPDDEARLRREFQSPSDPAEERELTPQARPNVLFEAGMALAVHPTRTVLVELGRLRSFQRHLRPARRPAQRHGTAAARRWLQDRDDLLAQESAVRSGELASKGLHYSGAHLASLAALRRDALHEYRDEITRKRRRCRELCEGAAAQDSVPRLVLAGESVSILDKWRAAVGVAGMTETMEVDDPTSQEREPDLRRFEREGDGPDIS